MLKSYLVVVSMSVWVGGSRGARFVLLEKNPRARRFRGRCSDLMLENPFCFMSLLFLDKELKLLMDLTSLGLVGKVEFVLFSLGLLLPV